MDRKQFLKLLGTSVATGFLVRSFEPKQAAAMGLTALQFSGATLADWKTVLGDGLWTAPNQVPVNSADIQTDQAAAKSILRANISHRGVMAHNITYKSLIDQAMFEYIHTTSYEFRLPYIPQTNSGIQNAQTFEGGFFIWDGSQTQLDYGCAFQWVLNPWMSTFGTIYSWSSDGTTQGWIPCGFLQPDTNWHQYEMMVDYHNQTCRLTIDQTSIPICFTATPKVGWGTETAARFQTEIISIWPGNTSTAPSHAVEIRNWNWNLQPYT